MVMIYADSYPLNLVMVAIFSGFIGWSLGPTIAYIGERFKFRKYLKSKAVLSKTVKKNPNATFVENLPQENAVFAGFQDGSVILSEIDETKKSYLIRNATGSEVTAISISNDKSHILIGDAMGNILWSPLWAGDN